ncbi:magnesium-translocating P-type ATPase [Cupriavidus numazuensis]|uniref:Magnesium-transporting ATPase, P-type 1 n=1 Tax=Cupriavidus numazuensis TaxID=221992 RepID=A0ABN7Q9F5_9BURK|nr:magnesium-translocating P-type ATPase [Cupriavidus numazuensis]CAG2160027.1 Magnesium-transporting ATPase, P-type 1 [Cupriavidus numazuensis]
MKVAQAATRAALSETPGTAAAADRPAIRPGASDVPPLLAGAAAGSVAQALAMLDADEQGLIATEVPARRLEHGANQIATERRHRFVPDLLARLRNPLNLMLLSLAALSGLIHDWQAASVITCMVALSVVLATWQESRSGKAAAALRAMVHTVIAVRRRPAAGAQSQTSDIPIAELVPGDVIHLAAGDLVPADVRLLTAKDLFVNQAALTGESMPVEKFAVDGASGETAGDIANLALMGTAVVSGTATALVVLTGRHAVFGHIARSIAAREPPTAFEEGLGQISRLMLGIIVVMAPLVFVINGLTKGDWFEALLFAVAVGVGLTPEMLPMLVTVNLAKGALVMSRRKVIIKRLNAIQNLGAMDVLCTDKTGTLTQDRVILKHHFDLSGRESEQVLEFAYLNSFFQSGLRNLLDVAVLQHEDVGQRIGIHEQWHLVDEIPFDFTRRRMSVVVESSQPGDERRLLICKGAVEEVFDASATARIGDTVVELDAVHRADLMRQSERLNEDGFRVIAIASKRVPAAGPSHAYGVADEAGMELVGYIAFIDPPKESAAAALAALRKSGIEVKILTGDSPRITSKVCRMVGLPAGRVVLGSDLDRLTPAELAEVARDNSLFARLNPAHKETLVRALRAQGRVVGVLGDGINDGPALKAADVGISVDNAVDIAKESAGVILLEKSLTVLYDGVLEGRRVFANLLKYLRMGASSNFGNIFSVLGASAWLPFLPMAPIQLLTNNLLYDISQTALPTDNVDDGALSRPCRWEVAKVRRYILCLGPVSSVFDYLTFAGLYWWIGANSPANAPVFQTGWFLESLLSQTLVVHIIRTSRIPFIESRASPALLAATGAICVLGVWLPYSPAASVLHLHEPPSYLWTMLVPILALYLLITFVVRRVLSRYLELD